jgi:hypothetical protein
MQVSLGPPLCLCENIEKAHFGFWMHGDVWRERMNEMAIPKHLIYIYKLLLFTMVGGIKSTVLLAALIRRL